MLSVRVRILWGDYPVHDVVLDPPRAFFLGENGDAALPQEILGHDRLEVVRVEGQRVFALGADGLCELAKGQTLVLCIGAFAVEVTLGEHVASPIFRFPARLRSFFSA